MLYSAFAHGRLPSVDPRSEAFPARRALALAGPSRPARKVTLDLDWQGNQRSEPKCVGFTGEALLKTAPKKAGVTKMDAHGLYQGAQQCDEWPGEGYDGSSILGLLKFLKDFHPAKDIQSFYWTTKVEEISAWLRTPERTAVPVGTNWYTSMYDSGPEGILKVENVISGGHAYLCIGDDQKRGLYLFQNSWSLNWSPLRLCRFWLSGEDFQRLLSEDGEAGIVTKFPRAA